MSSADNGGVRAWPALLAAPLFLAALVIWIAWPAFSGFFSGEDFTHWGAYQRSGYSFWTAVFQAHDDIFFRPSARAWAIASSLVLAPDPLLYHVRNCLFVLAALWLEYFLLLEITGRWSIAFPASLFIAVSKIHLTTIGYLAVFDSVVSWFHCAGAMYFLVLYLKRGRAWQLWTHIIFFALAVGSRDYGMAIAAPLSAAWILLGGNRATARRRVLAGYAGFISLYLLVRFQATGFSTGGAGAAYGLYFAPRPMLERALVLWSNLWNVSFDLISSTGLGTRALFPNLSEPQRYSLELLVVAAGTGLFLWSVRRSLREPWMQIGLVWAAVFFLPLLLIRNMAIYYSLEPLAGLAICLAVGLRANPAWLRGAWYACCALLLTLGIADGKQVRFYSWRFCADHARNVYEATIPVSRSHPKTALTFVANSEERAAEWSFILTANGKGPLLPYLLGRPDLQVSVGTSPMPRATQMREVGDSFALAEGNAKYRISPGAGSARRGFNLQSGGASALWIDCTDATRSTVVVFDGTKLATTYGGPDALSALVPKQLLSSPGRKRVALLDTATGIESEAGWFIVKP